MGNGGCDWKIRAVQGRLMEGWWANTMCSSEIMSVTYSTNSLYKVSTLTWAVSSINSFSWNLCLHLPSLANMSSSLNTV